MSRADLLAHLGAMALICAATTMSMANLPLLILETLRGTQVNVGITYSVAPVFELPFMLYFGWLATRRESVGIVRIGSTGGYFLFGSIAERLGYRCVFGVCAGFALLGLGLMFVPVRVPDEE